jgi:putative transposase
MHLKPRLSRLDSVYYEGAVFFITCCAHNRRPLLANDHIHDSFTLFCSAARERNILVGRYVIMPDHLHLFVHLPNPDELSSWMKSLKNFLSKALRNQGIQAPHWQRNYFDHVFRSEASAAEKWDYVRLNPVRGGLVSQESEWPYQGEIAMLG